MKKISLLVLLILLTGCSTTQQIEEVTSDPMLSESEPVMISEEEPDLINDSLSYVPEDYMVESYDYEDPEWEIVQSAVTSQNTSINSLNAFYLPVVDGLIYASATSDYDYNTMTQSGTQILHVFSYNPEAEELIEVYQSEVDMDVRVIASNGSDLILLESPIDFSPHWCTSLWAQGEAFAYKSLNIVNPVSLESYQVSQSLYEQGEKEFEDCMSEIEQNRLVF